MGWLCTMNSIKHKLLIVLLLLINVNQYVYTSPSSAHNEAVSKINQTTSSSSSTANDNGPSTRHESSTKVSTERLRGELRAIVDVEFSISAWWMGRRGSVFVWCDEELLQWANFEVANLPPGALNYLLMWDKWSFFFCERLRFTTLFPKLIETCCCCCV